MQHDVFGNVYKVCTKIYVISKRKGDVRPTLDKSRGPVKALNALNALFDEEAPLDSVDGKIVVGCISICRRSTWVGIGRQCRLYRR